LDDAALIPKLIKQGAGVGRVEEQK
jgi:hypothetical protein